MSLLSVRRPNIQESRSRKTLVLSALSALRRLRNFCELCIRRLLLRHNDSPAERRHPALPSLLNRRRAALSRRQVFQPSLFELDKPGPSRCSGYRARKAFVRSRFPAVKFCSALHPFTASGWEGTFCTRHTLVGFSASEIEALWRGVEFCRCQSVTLRSVKKSSGARGRN